MKKNFNNHYAGQPLILLPAVPILDDIYRQLDEQKKELATVKQLINAVTNKVSVVSYKELDDKSATSSP